MVERARPAPQPKAGHPDLRLPSPPGLPLADGQWPEVVRALLAAGWQPPIEQFPDPGLVAVAVDEQRALERLRSHRLRERSQQLRQRSAAAGERSTSLVAELQAVVGAVTSWGSAQEGLAGLADFAISVVPGADRAAVTVSRRGRLAPLAATDRLAEEMTEAETTTQRGPSLVALRQDEAVLVPDIRVEERWPAWKAAAGFQVCCALALPLSAAGRSRGVLTVLGSEPGCFDSSSVEIARLLADLATVALDGTTRAEQLSEAVENRDLIGQAKGILMACFAISPDEAFARLVRRSQAEHVKLHEICRRVVRQIQACPEAGGTSPRS